MTASQIARVLDSLVEQEVVRYAVVTSSAGDTVAQAGVIPQATRHDTREGTVSLASGAGHSPVWMMVEVGDGRILHVGTARRLPEPEVRQLRSLVASAL